MCRSAPRALWQANRIALLFYGNPNLDEVVDDIGLLRQDKAEIFRECVEVGLANDRAITALYIDGANCRK